MTTGIYNIEKDSGKTMCPPWSYSDSTSAMYGLWPRTRRLDNRQTHEI